MARPGRLDGGPGLARYFFGLPGFGVGLGVGVSVAGAGVAVAVGLAGGSVGAVASVGTGVAVAAAPVASVPVGCAVKVVGDEVVVPAVEVGSAACLSVLPPDSWRTSCGGLVPWRLL